MRKKRKGQSTLEYVILITGVVIVIIGVMVEGGLFQSALENTVGSTANGMSTMANRLAGSRPLSPKNGT